MNAVGTGTLDSVQKAAITADVAALLQDADTRTSVVLETVDGATFDPATGQTGAMTTQVSTTGWLSDLSLREVEQSGGTYQVGDRRLLVPAADFSTAPTVGATFRAGAVRHAALSVETDPLGLFYELVGRRTA